MSGFTGFISPPLETSPSVVAEDAFVSIETQIPGWQASPGNLDTLMIEALSEPAAEANDLASAALLSDFRYFGKLVNVPVIDAGPAVGSIDVTVSDTAGRTVPGGAVFGLRDDDGDLWGFLLVDDLVIAPGSDSGSGAIVAEIAGTGANELSGAAELVSVPGFVVSAVVSVLTDQGTDAEDDATYLDRLSETLTLLAPRPILPSDFAIMARSVAGVERAAAVDLLKPGPPYTGTAEDPAAAETITVAVTDAVGNDPGLTIRNAVQALLAGLREQNANIYVVAPQHSTVDVTVTVKALPNTDLADLQTRVAAAIASYLSGGLWGSVGNRAAVWINDPTVRASGLYAAIEAVQGVAYVPTGTLTFGLHGGAMGTSDVTLGAGSAIPALPVPGTISVTAIA